MNDQLAAFDVVDEFIGDVGKGRFIQ